MKVHLKKIFLLIIALLLFSPWAQAENENVEKSEEDPQVEITPSKGYGAKKIFFFPLELPAYAIKGLTFPLKALARFTERHHIPQKMYNLLTNDEGTLIVYPIIEVGLGSGFGAGVGVSHSDLFKKRYSFGASLFIFSDLDHRASFSFSSPPKRYLFNRPFSIVFNASWLRESDSDFYQPGNGSGENSKAEFGTNDFRAGFTVPYQVASTFTITPHVFVLQASTRSADSNSVEDRFAPALLPGFGRKLTHIEFGAAFAHDNRDSKSLPEKGGIRTFTFRRFQGVGNSGFDFNQLELDVRQYIPLWKPRYVLALRNSWIFQQETGTSAIPFYRLVRLDVESPLRAFNRGRFRDHGMVVFNVEYRYPVWDYIDGMIFLDTGRVFDDFEDFSFQDFKYSVGGGIRLTTRSKYLFRIQAAYGNEGTNVIFTAKQSF